MRVRNEPRSELRAGLRAGLLLRESIQQGDVGEGAGLQREGWLLLYGSASRRSETANHEPAIHNKHIIKLYTTLLNRING